MLSVHGLIPISIKQNQLSLFIQKQIQREKQISFIKKWGMIKLFMSGVEFKTLDMELKNNKLCIEIIIRIPVFFRLLFWKKETHVTLHAAFSFYVLQTGREPSFALDNSEISYFNIEGIPNFLNNLFTNSIENALEIEINRNMSEMNRVVHEYVSKEWKFPFSIQSKEFNLYAQAKQCRIVNITTENAHINCQVAISARGDLRPLVNDKADFVFVDLQSDICVQVTDDLIHEVLQSFLTDIHIPLISKHIPLALNEFTITEDTIQIRVQFSEWFKGEYMIRLEILADDKSAQVHLVEMKSMEKQSLIKKGIAKAIEYALRKLIDNTAEIKFDAISELINKNIDSPLYFKVGTDALKVNFPVLVFKSIAQEEGELILDVGPVYLNDVVLVEM